MLLSNARPVKGFTLLETLIVVIVMGILSAITAPSLIGMYNRSQVNDATAKVEGALLEIQRSALRRSKACNVSISNPVNPTVNPYKITSSTGCLVTGDRVLSGMNLAVLVNGSPFNAGAAASFQFAFNGQPMRNSGNYFVYPITIVVSMINGGAAPKCVMVSAPLGLIRRGTYSGTTCTVSQSQ